MTLVRYPPDDPREWLNRARSNLMQARMRQSGVYLEDLSYQAQQAAKKALKGLLLQQTSEFPYTHDIARLIALLDETSIQVPEQVREATVLSQFAYTTRYPGSVEPVSETEYEEAVEYAAYVVRWVETLVRESPDPDL